MTKVNFKEDIMELSIFSREDPRMELIDKVNWCINTIEKEGFEDGINLDMKISGVMTLYELIRILGLYKEYQEVDGW